MNSCFINKFNNSKIMFIVPHEDDEIILGGTFIYSLAQNSSADIYVVFLTNGDYRGKQMGLLRLNEAINSCKLLGVKAENVIFMGYPDIGPGEENNIFSYEDGFTFNDGMKQTYALSNHPEYHYIKHGVHASYGMKNMRLDLEELILDYKPDFIFYNDNDYHPIHRIESMTMDYVINKIFSENSSYKPEIFKGLSYDLSWLAPTDFTVYNLKGSKIKSDAIALNSENSSTESFSNPYIKSSDLIRFPIDSALTNNIITDNPVFDAARCHKTQLAAYLADRYINSDICFYKKRFDNLIGRKATLKINTEISDSEIARLYNSQTWYTNTPWIKQGEAIDYDVHAVNVGNSFEILLEKNANCSLFIYSALKSCVNKIKIYSGNNTYEVTACNNVFSLKNIEASNTIRIEAPSDEELLINEIELFEITIEDEKPWFVKLLVDNEYAYTYYTNSKKPNISAIVYNNLGDDISKTEDVVIEKTNGEAVRAYIKNHSEIADEIVIKRLTIFAKIRFSIVSLKNNYMFRYLRDVDVNGSVSALSKLKLFIKCCIGR